MNDIEQYVKEKNWEYRLESAGEEIVCKVCPVCNNNNWKFYINRNTGLYHCWICENDIPEGSGHISTIKKLVGDIVPIREVVSKKENAPDYSERVEIAHEDLKNNKSALKYLLKRGISMECIEHFKLGYEYVEHSPVITIPCFEDGVPRLLKHRSLSKGASPKYKRTAGGKSILFNQDIIEDSNELFITEGEFDAMALWTNGYKNVIGNTGGAGTLKPDWYDKLKLVSKIYCCYDNDEVGEKSAKTVIAKRLGFGKVYRINLPDGIKDTSDFFQQYSTNDFNDLIANAKLYSLPGVLSIEDAIDEIRNSALEDKESYIVSPWSRVNKALNKGIRNKNLMVLGAPPKIGKTTFALQWATYAARILKIPTLFFCLEMPFEELARMVVCNVCKQNSNFLDPLDSDFWVDELKDVPLYIGYSSHISMNQVEETFKEAQNRYGVRLAVFDNLHWLVRSENNVSDLVGLTTRRFKELAMDMNIPIILIAQPRKLTGDKPMNYWDLRDSSSIPADADILCILHRGRRDDGGFKTETKFIVDAGRHTKGGRAILNYEEGFYRFNEGRT